MTPLSFILGNARLRFVSPRPMRLINAARRAGLPYRKLTASEREVSFEVLLPRLKILQPFLDTVSCAEEIVIERSGLPVLLKRYRRRWGFFLGLAIFISSFLLAGCFVWGIDITGTVKDPEIVFSDLVEAGLKPGVWGRDMDTDKIARKLLVARPEYAYAGIRLVGMRAMVELRDADVIDRSDPSQGYSNLIANGSGRVVRSEVLSGEGLKKTGEIVNSGELLISGIRRTQNGSFVPTRARGRVFCETEDVFETFVPFSETKTVFSGEETTYRSYSLLGKHLLSSKNEAPYEQYERQVFWEPVRFLGCELPVYRETVVYSEKTEKMTEVDVDRARDIAYDEYIEYKEILLGQDGEIKDESFAWEVRADGVYLCVRIYSVRDVCQEKTFTILVNQ